MQRSLESGSRDPVKGYNKVGVYREVIYTLFKCNEGIQGEVPKCRGAIKNKRE